MANVAALKKKAADFEAKKQYDKAIAAYREVLDAYDSGDNEDLEIALYNRVGDLLSRQGNTPDAVTLYERAVDLYTEGGFFNNAIALCNKVLRTSPGRASIYYKLGKISAAKGFKGEAKQNFLEYADRMQKSGQMDEAFRALKEFAELVPDQDDVRLMLAEQFTKAGKTAEALEQLEELYHRHEAAGRSAEMQATLDRMKAIDPSFEPRASESQSAAKSDDLIFIDLDAPPVRSTRATHRVAIPVPEPPAASPPAEPARQPAAQAEPQAEEARGESAAAIPLIEITSAALDGAGELPPEASSLLGLEPTSLGDTVASEPEPLDANEFDEINLAAIPEARSERDAGLKDLALGGDLPQIDLEPGADESLLEIADDDRSSSDVVVPLLDFGGEPELPGIEPTALVAADDGDGQGRADLPIIDVGDDEAPRSARVTGEVEAVIPDEPTAFGAVDESVVAEPAPPVRRSSAMLAVNSVLALRVKVEDSPEDWALRRQFGEALLDAGERDEGMRSLEVALAGFDKIGDIDNASSIADEIVRLDPSSVRYHNKRVEYAFRAGDKVRTAEAYIALADALLRNGQAERARTVYQRVLEISPANASAQAALESLLPTPESTPSAAPSAAPSAPGPRAKRYTGVVESVPTQVPGQKPAGGDDDLVALGDWLRAEEEPKSTRMVVEEQEPTGDEQADFADMLRKFKQGISENVEEEDHESHYDLGVAYKEMGLVDEAIAEFQKALRGTQNRARTFEALGQCFLEKKQLPVATTILTRALNEPGVGEEQLVGVLYLLGYVHEAQGKMADAKAFYERVFAVDIQFRDVTDRLNSVDKALK